MTEAELQSLALGTQIIAAGAQIVAAVATILIVILTLRQVRASRDAVDEMRAGRLASDQPRVVAYPVLSDPRKVDIIIENVGRSPASNVSVVAAERDSQGAVVAGMVWTELHDRQLVSPGTYLPAGVAVRRLIMEGSPLEARAEFGFSRVDVTCTWDWQEEGRSFESTFPVDPAILLKRPGARTPPPRIY
jgi:hypothetical protein